MSLKKRLFALFYERSMAKYEEYIADRKEALFANLPSHVCEIGPGMGANLRFLKEGTRWIGFEPNPYMHAKFQEKAQELGLQVDLRHGEAGHLDLESNSVDAALSTLVLCSVPSPRETLGEIYRVLKPGGRFYFIEHVAAPSGTGLRRAQRFMRPIWRWFGDGCCVDRETSRDIHAMGFSRVEMDCFRVPKSIMPAFVSPHIAGYAVK